MSNHNIIANTKRRPPGRIWGDGFEAVSWRCIKEAAVLGNDSRDSALCGYDATFQSPPRPMTMTAEDLDESGELAREFAT